MDETGQPGGEPAGVSGNGAHGKGVARVNANGWQQPDPQDTGADGAHGETAHSAAGRPGSLHAADSAWSAGSREPAMEPIPSWRRSAITQLTERPEQPRRLADLLAPVNPPVPPPFPFDGAHGPDGQPAASDPAPVQPGPGLPVNGSTGYAADRSFPPVGHQSEPRQPWAPRSQAVPDDFDAYRSAPAPFEDLPALAQTTAATRAAQNGEAGPEPAAPEQGWLEQGWPVRDLSPARSSWAVPASGEPMPVPPPPAAGTYRSAVPVDRHRRDPGPSTDAEPDGPVRFNGTAPVSPAVPFHGGAPPMHSGPAHSGPPHSGPMHSGPPHSGPPHPGSPRAEPSNGGPPRAEPHREPPQAESPYPGSPYPEGVRPDPARHEPTGRGAAHAPAEAPQVRAEAPQPARAPGAAGAQVRESLLDDPWADPARYAAAYRESMSAIRAASVGVAAAEALASAEDRAAVQAAYVAAVDSVRPVSDPAGPGAPARPAPAPQPVSPNTPLGQPSLADYTDRPTGGHRLVPQPEPIPPHDPAAPREMVSREAVIPRQSGPSDQLAPLGQPAHPAPPHRPAATAQPAHPAPAGRPAATGQPAPPNHPQTIQATPLSPAAHPGQPGPSHQPERSVPTGQPTQPGGSGPVDRGPSALPVPPVLPQRIPAAPDVPEVPDDLADEEFVDHGPDLAAVNPPELARIATGLRYNEDLEEPPRPDGFDTLAVLAAVRAVPGVRDAQLRPNPTGGGVHTLRLDLADGADGAQVSRLVARLLKQRMGLAAEPRRSADARRSSVATPAPNTGQPHRDSTAMPIAGASPSPRVPMPASAAEQLGGPLATNATDDRSRRRPVPVGRSRALEPDEPHRVIRSAAGPRVIIDQVQVSTLGLDATVEVRLTSGGTPAIGVASGPAVDGYVLRLAAVAATAALDQLLATVDSWEQPGRCFVEHAAVVPFGSMDIAVVVVLLVCGSSAEQLTGSALVAGDPRQAVVRATLAAMNRRLDTLLS